VTYVLILQWEELIKKGVLNYKPCTLTILSSKKVGIYLHSLAKKYTCKSHGTCKTLVKAVSRNCELSYFSLKKSSCKFLQEIISHTW